LTSFDYAQLNPQICTNLNLSYNKLEPTDLAVFSPLVNLTNLDISDNKFFGSLEFLQNCTRLKYLDISNTNINQGLEYLPESLETFLYSSSADSNFQVQIIEKEINNQGND
jgi:Leucine-rich repeat (LRR) protein